MPQIELDLGRWSTPSTTSPTSRPSMKIAQSKQKFRRQSKNRFPPAIRLVSSVEPAPTRNRTLLGTTSAFLRGEPQVPRASGLPGHVRCEPLDPAGDKHKIVGKPEPESKEILIDDALQALQCARLTLDRNGAEKFRNRFIRFGVCIASRIPACRVRSNVPGRSVEIEVGKSRELIVGVRDEIVVSARDPSLVECVGR